MSIRLDVSPDLYPNHVQELLDTLDTYDHEDILIEISMESSTIVGGRIVIKMYYSDNQKETVESINDRIVGHYASSKLSVKTSRYDSDNSAFPSEAPELADSFVRVTIN